MDISIFQHFLACCVGNWITERTYHYFNEWQQFLKAIEEPEVERSRTEFQVIPLNIELKKKVLSDNNYQTLENLEDLLGYNLEFKAVSEKGDKFSQKLNLLFIPKEENKPYLEGDYLRDKGYEEARPIKAHFRFDSSTRELLMTTNYTRFVSVDSITLINPELRIRKIINYFLPPEGQPLQKVRLVGFGVEQKIIK